MSHEVHIVLKKTKGFSHIVFIRGFFFFWWENDIISACSWIIVDIMEVWEIGEL